MTTVTPLPKAKKRKTKKKQSLSKQCDVLAGRIARSRGVCCTADDGRECKGPLQWSHGFPRNYHAVRWDERNGLCQCRSDHWFYTNHPLEWQDFLRREWGDELFDELWALAQTYTMPDLKVLVVELRDRWNEIEAAA